MSPLSLLANVALFAAVVAGAGLIVLWPLARRPRRWPADPAPDRDDVARIVSSLAELEFARAAGTIEPADEARLRARLERVALRAPPPSARRRAPVAALGIAALLSGIAAIAIAVSLPREVGDRAPGGVLTGDGGRRLAPTTADLEARLAAAPGDIPTRLALAEAYADAGRLKEASGAYQAVLGLDRQNIPALDGLGLILLASGESDGAMVAADRVLTLRPRDPDALFIKGVALYRRAQYEEAVAVWDRYFLVAEGHPYAGMVRQLYEEAQGRLQPGR